MDDDNEHLTIREADELVRRDPDAGRHITTAGTTATRFNLSKGKFKRLVVESLELANECGLVAAVDVLGSTKNRVRISVLGELSCIVAWFKDLEVLNNRY